MKKTALKLVALLLLVLFVALALAACGDDGSPTVQPDKQQTSHTHTFGAYQYDSAEHWQSCSGCGTVKRETHSFDPWIVLTPATATSAGVKSRTCSACGYTETEAIPAVQCSDHQYGAWTTTKQATATENGEKQRYCTICGHVETETIPASGATTYQISFNLNGGSSPSAVAFKKVTELKASDFFFDVKKTGSLFRGWSYNETKVFDENGKKVADVTLKSGMTFVAVWSNKAKLTLETNLPGAGTFSGGGEYDFNTNVNLTAHPNEGYEFVGWMKGSNNLSSQEEYNCKMWSEDVTLTAYFQPKSYNLTLKVNNTQNGQVKIGSTTVYYNQQTQDVRYTTNVQIAAYSKTDVRFLGWFDENGILIATNAVYSFVMPNHDYTLTATWEQSSYNITYNYNGGTGSNLTTYQVADGYTLTAPTKSGCEFLGWTGSNGTTPQKNVTIPKGSKGDKVYTANWKAATYTISYDLAGGTNNTANPKSYTVESGTIALKDPTRTGYTFKGWKKNGSTVTAVNSSWMANVTLTATWEPISYTISYTLGGGTASNPATYTVEDSINLATPTRAGYTFTGWTGSNGTTPQKSVTIPKGTTGNKSYTANWQLATYTISYAMNGGTNNGSNPTSYTINSGTLSLYTPTRENYDFVEWRIDSNKVTSIDPSQAKDLTVTAVWQAHAYTISYDLGGGTASNPTSYTVESKSFSLTDPTRTGYTFLGWTGSNGETPEQSVTIPKGTSGDKSYTANWQINTYTISYAMNSGTNNESNPKSYTVESGTLTLYTPTRDNYDFVEWRIGSTKVTSIDPSQAKDLTVTAIWRAHAYTISYAMNGGTASNPATYTVESAAFSLTAPEREGYIFLGWTGWNGETPETAVTVPQGTSGDLAFTANWQINRFTLTFVSNGGSSVAPITLEYNAPLTLPKSSWAEKSMVGWFDSTLTSEYSFTAMPAEDLTLYAKWIEYGVTMTSDEVTILSVSDDPVDPATYRATAIDTDGDPVSVTVQILSGTHAAGKTVTVRLVATGKYGIYDVKTIGNIKVYGTPTLDYNEEKDSINLSDTLNAELFGASATDSFGVAIPVSVNVKEAEYAAGDLVTVVLSAVDAAGNEITAEIENVKVYGAPVVTRNTEKNDMKASDEIANELFGVSAVDSFGVSLSVTTELQSGTVAGGNTVTVRSCATDSKGNAAEITYTVKVYGLPVISNATKTAFKVDDTIDLTTLGIVAKDSFGATVSDVTLELTDGEQTAGSTLTYLVTATDRLGNVNTKEISGIRIYGTPVITFDTEKATMNVSDAVNAALLSATAKDSHNGDLAVSVTLESGTVAGGNTITVRLSATDALGNTAAVVTQEIRVYSADTITLTYNGAASTRIKKTSRGEEFGASAVDGFGDACALSIEAADGSVLAGGNTVGLYIVATDALGNTVRSNLITGIRVYDTPTLTYAREYPYIQDGDSPYSLFTLTDSFGAEILFTVTTVSGSLDVNETIVYRITGTDRTGNPFDETRELVVLAADESILELYDNGELVGTQRVTRGSAYSLPTDRAPWTDGSVILTDADGNSLANWDGEPNGYSVYCYAHLAQFDPAGGEYPIENRVYDAHRDHPLTEATRSGYAFVGWYTESDEKITNLQGHYTDLTLTARWELLLEINDSGAITGVTDYFKQQITEYTIPAAVDGTAITSVAANAFANCTNLTSVTIPDSVTSIGSSAFYGCSSLESITIPFVGGSRKTASNTYQYPFGYIFGTSSYTGGAATSQNYYGSSTSSSTWSNYYIPSSLKSVTVAGGNILGGAFSNCSGLTSVTIGNGVTSIGGGAFKGCYGLTSITIPDGVTSIGSSAFYNCTGLTSVTIGNGVTSIGGNAFYDCSGLTSIAIGNGVTSIGNYAFENCSGLTAVYYTGDIAGWCRIEFGYDANPLLYAENLYINDSLVTDLVIPNGVTSIGFAAFEGCTSLTSVTIPNSVTSIGEWAFSGCSGLTSITIPDSVTSIRNKAFRDCSGLTSVTIPDSVTSIGESAFRSCSRLTSVTIPDGVTSIGDYAFSGCYKLIEVRNLSALNITAGSSENGYVGYYAKRVYVNGDSYLHQTDDGYLFYDDGTEVYLVAYLGTDTDLILPTDYNGEEYAINQYAFSGCSKLTSVIIPDRVTSIGEGAFSGCSGLTSVIIPDGVRFIGWYAFSGCSGLTSVTIGNSVTSIGQYAFYRCSGLTSVTIPDGVTHIGLYAFSDCSGLKSVTFANTGWYVVKISSTSGIGVTVTNASTNATNLKSAYCNYNWYRK